MKRLTLSLTALLGLQLACKSGGEVRPEEPVGKATPAASADQTWRETPPQPGEPPELVLPSFERASLPNGMTVLVSSRKELPLVSLNVACAAGSAADPTGKAGLADLSYRMLLEGAGNRDALALDDAFQDLGTTPAVSVSPDGALVGVTVLKRNAEPALGLLADVARRPRLAAKDFDRRKAQQLADLAQRVGNPGYLAQEAFAETVFGKAHPYGHLSSGTPSTVSGLNLKDVKGFLSERMGPSTCALIASGDVSLQQAQQWGQQFFGDWKSSAKALPPPPEPGVTPRQGIVFVPKPGLNQTVVVMGRPALPAGHPDEQALELATTVFGGFFGSRLNMNLREAKGYTYGAGAGVDARRGVGPMSAASSVRADVTGPALREFYNEVQSLQRRPITAQELETAREGVIRSVPGTFETVEGLASTAALIYFKGMPLDRVARIVEGLQSADLAAVQAAAEKYYQPETMKIVLVGDPAAVQQQVPELQLGELQTRQPPSMPGGASAAAGR